MGFKEEFKREMRNAKNDAAKEVDKYWAIHFEGHKIEIHNKLLEETLLVDGRVIASKKRQSIWSHLAPYSTLSGSFQTEDGKHHKVHVKIGGMVRLNITVKVNGQVILKEAVKLEFLPWTNKEFIVPYLEQQIREHQKMMHSDLPDDAYLVDENHPKLTPGLSDRLISEGVTPFYTKKLLKLFMEQVENPTNQTRKATYEKIKDEKVISYFQELIELFVQEEKNEQRVQQEAIWLLEHAAHREVVKFAIIILGCTNCEGLKERLQMLALHEEFTGVALFALKNGTSNANDAIWQIAKSVNGWGKIEAIEFLEPDTEEIRLWFLTEGTQNTVMNSYSSLTCAEKGKLDILLHEPDISEELFIGAGEIILGLLGEASHQAIDGYEYAGQVFMRYTYHAKTHYRNLEQFYILTQIAEYMDESDETWEERYATNWRPHERHAVQEAIEEIAKNPLWVQQAWAILHSEETNDIKALAVAQHFKLDITELLLEKLKKEPNNLAYHLAIIATQDQKVIEALVASMDRFDSFENLTEDEHYMIITLLEALKEFEGTGLHFIEKGLRSGDPSIQYFALSTLEVQDKMYWQPELVEGIKEIASKSKDKENRELAKELIS
ncbi:hypothetical protein [Lysinibacillus sp. SGAir0095]|uniref:hypothetical protein n=1 Tax=Lysinibacillus sp. SGAir0095 TaxID=2070463 RepID=UPI0010CD2A2E|nr:hypothetical protein [Lysinibacillus sp. SGAir0095]QCR31115.1 hypothetical protein C1N55_02630 [Lysinibacillus sp. SGAir0095]